MYDALSGLLWRRPLLFTSSAFFLDPAMALAKSRLPDPFFSYPHPFLVKGTGDRVGSGELGIQARVFWALTFFVLVNFGAAAALC